MDDSIQEPGTSLQMQQLAVRISHVKPSKETLKGRNAAHRVLAANIALK